MQRSVVEVPGVSEGIRKAGVPLSAAIKANGFVFVSGQAPMDLATGKFVTGNIEAQTEQCLICLKQVLEAAGSSLEKVCKVTIFASNSGHYRRINEVYARFFPKDPPARTFVAVGSWPMDFDIEIECVAVA
jgi:2-iminobutanoate/2-iminopropanoate deaminase